ncbi:hypothetical protein P3S68_024046 [Capsicum galapagoense]
MAYELDEQNKVGLGLIGFGILFTFLAIILFFDRDTFVAGCSTSFGLAFYITALQSKLQAS